MSGPLGPGYVLNLSGNAKIDGTGKGTVQLGPKTRGDRWQLSVAAIRIPGAILIPQCFLYMGATPTDDNLVDATYSGAQNSSTRVTAFPLTLGYYIFAVWIGADVGATATLSIYGNKT